MKSNIKVIHIADKFGVKNSSVHGVSRLFSWWMPRFDRDRYDVRLIGLRKPDEATKNLRDQGINITSLSKGKFDFSVIKNIVQIVRKEKTDILHLHGYGATNFGRIASRIAKVKNIVHEHFVDPNMPKYQIPFDWFLSPYTNLGMANCTAVKEFMVKKRFLPKQKVRVIFNGVPIHEFKPLEDGIVMAERKRWGIPEGYKIVATIGRLDEQKGNKYFLDAAEKLLKKGHKVKFLIVGDGPLLNELQEQCNRYNIEKDVIFTGYHENIPLMLNMLYMLVIPSLWEGTTLTVFEAMSMKLPIVSTYVDGLGEVLRHEDNAILVNPMDSKGLAIAIERILNDEQKAEQIAAKAYKDSYDFDIQRTVDQLQNVYDELMN